MNMCSGCGHCRGRAAFIDKKSAQTGAATKSRP
jgi:hypothetical protein